MPWLQLRIITQAQEASSIEASMLKAGACAVTLEDNADQPIFEPELGETPLWSDTRVTGLFDADIDTQQTLDAVRNFYRKPINVAKWHVLEDKDWEREWEKNYHPIQCSENFWICPSWTEPPNPNATNLMLDPGLAFGTGTHPTTFMCLKWLATQNVIDCDVIDYGCGSGILGIAALLLGARHVHGVDIDPQALIATQNNAKGNKISPEIFPVYLPCDEPTEPCDVVLANILAGPLVELAPKLLALLKPDARICLSGVINTQKQNILDAYQHDVEFDEIFEQDEWICLTGTKKKTKTQ